MKIKVKKEMNLHQLIQWARENNVKGETFTSNYGRQVKFYSDVSFNTMAPIYHWDTFTVEAEEEITERTVIPLLLEVYEYDESLHMHLNKNLSIKAVLDESLLDKSLNDLLFDPRAFHILNDDMTMTLVWKDGELVE
ncbi:hypothetical protein DNI27_13135 [Staphylococcus pseudintermedius]|uniref:hypothetical protein n=1 Tax=Staphylococcus pseudintermedius TaxID=283734 RepID=UPI0015F23FE1|nr:hypothetical protein [Staphylococcus pseudintermedius]EHT7970081.1 hypothetical protein [Staphylococcus pseudintermedius]EII6327538.1 hypothetical protein [Staphylococcus pseudintermedius]EJA1907035.1 hypothetical protein [Staphylococcus pseudintermedius]EJL1766277.1 hypothetical protein [Staphylococcus pseudintermedius]QDX56153.1 hypothetical protein DNI27_13135 [Staphylococcus pseudintermedius]